MGGLILGIGIIIGLACLGPHVFVAFRVPVRPIGPAPRRFTIGSLMLASIPLALIFAMMRWVGIAIGLAVILVFLWIAWHFYVVLWGSRLDPVVLRASRLEPDPSTLTPGPGAGRPVATDPRGSEYLGIVD